MAKNNELLNELNRLIDSSKIARSGFGHERPSRSFAIENGHLVFQGQTAIRLLNATIDLFWDGEGRRSDLVSREYAEKALINFITPYCVHRSHVSLGALTEYLKAWESLAIRDWHLFTVVEGIVFGKSNGPLKLGPFVIYDYPNNPKSLEDALGDQPLLMQIRAGMKDMYFISVSVKAAEKDLKQAENLAVRGFAQFENIIRTMLGYHAGEYGISVSEPLIARAKQIFFVRDGQTGWVSKRTGPSQLTVIDDDYFIKEEFGRAWVWRTLMKEARSDLESRIIAAIEWIGKALKDADPARTLVQYVFALEALLTVQKKGVLINPSIASQISEFAAFIVGRDFDTRIGVETAIKEIYQKRSAIVHSGSTRVSERDLGMAFRIIKELIRALTTEQQFLAFKSMEDVRKWVNQQKYSNKSSTG